MAKERSEAQAEASRMNGSRSTGPRTDEGKTKASTNAVVHGIRAERVILAHEDPALYVEHVEKWAACLKPGDPAEMEIVATIADLRWRLQRLDHVEMNRTRAEVLARLEDTAEQKYVRRVEDAVTATATMVEVLACPHLRDDDDLQGLLGAVRSVIDMLRLVEREQPKLSLRSDELAEAVAIVAVLSVREIDGDAYVDLVGRARACAESVAALLPSAQQAAERAREELTRTVPLPDAKQVALWTRYRQDIGRRLQVEMAFLAAVRERKELVAVSGSLGEPVEVRVRLTG